MKSIAVVSNRRNSGKTVTQSILLWHETKWERCNLIDADEQAKINFYLGARERNTFDDVLKGKGHF